MKKIILTFFGTSLALAFGQTSTQTYFLGHSLVNLNMPAMFHSLALDAGYSGNDYDYQIGIGANLWAQWAPPYGEQGILYYTALPGGTYDNFVFTEAVPLKPHLTYSYTHAYADSLFDMAYAGNNAIRTYFYETWHCIASGDTGCGPWDPEDHIDWRLRLSQDLDDWESVVDSLEAWNPSGSFYIVPGGQGMARLYDAIGAGNVPGVSNISHFYSDEIHLTNEGNYYIACIMFATLYGQSPVGLTNATYDEWGGAFTVIPTALATRLQELAWETVCNYPRSGVQCNVGITHAGEKLELRYLPGQGIVLPESMSGHYRLYDISGRMIAQQEFTNQPQLPVMRYTGTVIATVCTNDGKMGSLHFVVQP